MKIAINGYGNLGRGVESAILQNPDMELVGIFTRRNPADIKTTSKVYSLSEVEKFVDKIDVMIMCGGSATDLPLQVPKMLELFNTVDSFDTHSKIPEYYNVADSVGKKYGHLAAISIGWDPGLFSMARLLFSSVTPCGSDYTFWGKGVSQGHSDAIRRIEGVENAIQYTIPIESTLEKIRAGENQNYTAREKHLRECFVAVKEGADKQKIEQAIKTMPAYFADYNTVVHFITNDELKEKHSKLAHGGFVLRNAESANNSKFNMEFSLKLESNPEFTASVLVAFARATYRLAKEGKTGAITCFDVPLSYLSPSDKQELYKNML